VTPHPLRMAPHTAPEETMSAAPEHDEQEPNHEGPIRTPKQLVVAVLASFIVPIVVIVLLAMYVTSATKPSAGSEGLGAKATEQRIAPVASVQVKDASKPAVLKTGTEAYKAQCGTCHEAGLAGAPKFGDTAAWAPRVKTGYEALLTSALKGKGAMSAQGGGDLSDLEIGRAVAYMANAGGAKFDEPAAPPAAASAP
jgi:cytochrome c5